MKYKIIRKATISTLMIKEVEAEDVEEARRFSMGMAGRCLSLSCRARPGYLLRRSTARALVCRFASNITEKENDHANCYVWARIRQADY